MQRNKTPTKYLCDYCNMEFTTKHLRDGHLVSHFDHIIGDVWERVEQMQSQFTDQRLVNQCPICFHVMGSRKSFKMHIIQKHLMKNPETFMGEFAFYLSAVLAFHECGYFRYPQ
ncbi:unnamed protein product [Cylicostephanus goldi]|uniref:C2H2-type domain-containing protein n=1 Tax=Cylicostephanus goldi TaxID=71465 RepID=A0A3P6RZB6_CYLGO|nr:unnamed protein product [Cylicostephanus goldi]